MRLLGVKLGVLAHPLAHSRVDGGMDDSLIKVDDQAEFLLLPQPRRRLLLEPSRLFKRNGQVALVVRHADVGA